MSSEAGAALRGSSQPRPAEGNARLLGRAARARGSGERDPTRAQGTGLMGDRLPGQIHAPQERRETTGGGDGEEHSEKQGKEGLGGGDHPECFGRGGFPAVLADHRVGAPIHWTASQRENPVYCVISCVSHPAVHCHLSTYYTGQA